MLKKYRKTLIIGTIMMLLPMLVGLILWNKLPEQVPTHFDVNGVPDDYSSKAFAVFGLPAILLGLHWLCVLGSLLGDPKVENMQSKVFTLVLWVCPIMSILLMGLVYSSALGVAVPVQVIIPLLLGVMTVAIGNWLPKCKQTWTLGIKLPWTLASEDNWNRTHRFAGPIWVGCGLVIMASAMLGDAKIWVILGALAVMIVPPTIYSYLLFKGRIK